MPSVNFSKLEVLKLGFRIIGGWGVSAAMAPKNW
jgi:hypothetical protein